MDNLYIFHVYDNIFGSKHFFVPTKAFHFVSFLFDLLEPFSCVETNTIIIHHRHYNKHNFGALDLALGARPICILFFSYAIKLIFSILNFFEQIQIYSLLFF